MKVATPRGLIPTRRKLPGIITSATLRVRALPAVSEQRQYLFPDFAAGLAALHEAERHGILLSDATLEQLIARAKLLGAKKVTIEF